MIQDDDEKKMCPFFSLFSIASKNRRLKLKVKVRFVTPIFHEKKSES